MGSKIHLNQGSFPGESKIHWSLIISSLRAKWFRKSKLCLIKCMMTVIEWLIISYLSPYSYWASRGHLLNGISIYSLYGAVIGRKCQNHTFLCSQQTGTHCSSSGAQVLWLQTWDKGKPHISGGAKPPDPQEAFFRGGWTPAPEFLISSAWSLASLNQSPGTMLLPVQRPSVEQQCSRTSLHY